jgi:uncharacterized protein
MRDGKLLVTFDPIRMGRNGFKGSGFIAVSQMRRLAQRLSDTGDKLEVALEIGQDDQDITFARGTVNGDVTLICQRCLLPMRLPIQIEYQVAFVDNEYQLDQLPAHYEPVITDEFVKTATMIEDEVLLSLPIVALHPAGKCNVNVQADTVSPPSRSDDESPFAVLRALKDANQDSD